MVQRTEIGIHPVVGLRADGDEADVSAEYLHRVCGDLAELGVAFDEFAVPYPGVSEGQLHSFLQIDRRHDERTEEIPFSALVHSGMRDELLLFFLKRKVFQHLRFQDEIDELLRFPALYHQFSAGIKDGVGFVLRCFEYGIWQGAEFPAAGFQRFPQYRMKLRRKQFHNTVFFRFGHGVFLG